MTKEQALQVLKLTLDKAIKNGIAENIQEANAIAAAFQTIINELSKNDN